MRVPVDEWIGCSSFDSVIYNHLDGRNEDCESDIGWQWIWVLCVHRMWVCCSCFTDSCIHVHQMLLVYRQCWPATSIFPTFSELFLQDLLKLVQSRFSPHEHWGRMLKGRLISWMTQSTLATAFGIEKLGYMRRSNRFAYSKLSILLVLPLDYGGRHNPIYRKKKETVKREIYISA